MTATRTRSGATAILVCTLLAVSACSLVGPQAVRNGRLAYNEAIIETDNQQMLLAAVHNRYGERSSLLAVSSITANVRVAGNAGAEAGVGDSDNYAGNLVPFSAGITYEENPTISYTPVGGERYARELMSPLPLGTLAMLAGSLTDPAPVYYMLVSTINDIYNPEFLSAAVAPDPRFARVVDILSELTLNQHLHWFMDPLNERRLVIVIDHYRPGFTAAVTELFELLGMPGTLTDAERITLPVSMSLEAPEAGVVGITTRSVYDLMEILSGATEIPEEDRNVAPDYPPPGEVGKGLRIHHARARPVGAMVAVEYRNGWFYIDETDQATKEFFRLLSTLLSVKIAESASGASGKPVLTVPVSR